MKKHTLNIRNILLVSLMVLALGVSAMAVTPGTPAVQAAAASPASPATPAAGTATGSATTPTPGSTVVSVTDGFAVMGDAAGYDYDQTNGVLTVKDGAVLQIANAASAETAHKIVVERDASVDLILAGVNIDVSSGDDNCAFLITKGSTGSVTLTLADGTTNILRSGYSRAGLEKEGTSGSLTIRCAHSGESGHICDPATCGALEASSYTSNVGQFATGAGIGGGTSPVGTSYSAAVANITISGGNVAASSYRGAGIGSGFASESGAVSNITISGGNVTASSNTGAGIGSGRCNGSNSGAVSCITISGGCVTASSTDSVGIGSGLSSASSGAVLSIAISGGSLKASSTKGCGIGKGGGGSAPETASPVTPTDGKGIPVYLCKMAISAPATSVTVNGTSYGKHIYHDGSGWTTEDNAYIYLPNGFYPYGESGTLMANNGTVTLDPIPTTVDGGFTVWGDAAGYDYDQTNGVLTVKGGAVLQIANAASAATAHKIAVAENASANITLAGVNIDVSSGDDNCAFLITKDSTGSVTLTLADGATNILKSGKNRAGLEKEGTSGSLTIRCAHSGESGHICDPATCGTLEASSYDSNYSKYGHGAGIGSGSAIGRGGAVANIAISGGNVAASSYRGAGIGGGFSVDDNGAVSNITISGGNVTASSQLGPGIGSGSTDGRGGAVSNIAISGGNVTASSDSGAGIGSGYASNSGAVSNITISGGNVTASSQLGAGIGSGYAITSGAVSNITISGGNVTASGDSGAGIGSGFGSNRGAVSNITISGGSVKASGKTAIGKGDGTAVLPTDGKGNNVYLYEIDNPEGKPVTIGGVAYPPKHIYHNGTTWTSEGKLYPYFPGDGSAQIITVDDTTTVKVYNSVTNAFEDPIILLLDSTGATKGGYSALAAAVNAAANGDTIKLVDNVTTTATVNIGKKLTLDLNGKTVSWAGISKEQMIMVETAGDLTVRDSATGGKLYSGSGYTVYIVGKFTLESGILDSDTAGTLATDTAGSATLKGGTVSGGIKNNGTLYADGGEVIGGTSASTNLGTITHHADAAGMTKFYGMLGNLVQGGSGLCGTLAAGEFYGEVMNGLSGSSRAGLIKPVSPGSIVINGSLIFGGGKNGIDSSTTVDVTKEYLTDTLKLGGTGYVQVDDTRYVYGASGLSAAATSGGTLVLMKDVSIPSTLTISGTITLDLNGYALKYESENKGGVIAVMSGANFTLKDSSAARTGKITGGWGGYRGGGVCNTGTFTMEGGTISGCSVASNYAGGGVFNDGTFIMKGGTISGCDVYCGSVLKNDSATDATIVYGALKKDHGSITGKLVEFIFDENIYAWEIVPSGSKVVKPVDPEKTGYKFLGWYNGDEKFNFDTDIVADNLVLTAVWERPDYVGTLQDAQNDLQNSIDALNTALAGKADADTINAAIAALQSSVNNLTNLLNTKAAQADLETLNQTVSNLSTALSVLDAAKNNYVDADATLKAELQDIIDDANEAQNLVIEALKTRLTEAETKITNLTNSKADATEVAEALEDLNDIIDAVKLAYKDADDALKGELQDAIDGAVETINTTINGLKDRLTEAENDIIDLINNKADAAEVAEALENLNNIIEAVKQAYQDADGALKDELLDYINRANDTQDGTIIALRYRLTEAEKNLEALTESKADAAEVAEALSELNELIEAVKQAYAAADDELKEELQASIDSAVETLNETIDDIKQRLSTVEASVAELLESKADALDVSNALNELRESIAALEAVKEAYKGADEELKQALQASIDGAVETLNATINGLKDRVSAAEQDIASLIENKADASEVQKALDELSAAIDALEAVKDNYASADESLKSELTQKITDAQSVLQESIGKVSADLTAAQEALNKAIADGDKDLADKIAALNEQLELAKSALNKADADSKAAIEAQVSAAQSALSEAVDALSEELAALKTELTEKDDQLQTFTTVVCVIASLSFVGIAVFVIWFFLDRKKHI